MSGVPSYATIWFAIWGDRRTCWLRGTGQLLFSLKSHPEGPPPRSHHQGLRATTGPGVSRTASAARSYCLRCVVPTVPAGLRGRGD